MNYYESITILDPALSDEDLASATEKITSLITKNGGEILKNENWGKKNLAYEINKKKKGFYLFLVLRAPSTLVKQLEDYYKVFDPVFKYIMVKLGKKQTAALMKSIQAPVVPQAQAEAEAPGV